MLFLAMTAKRQVVAYLPSPQAEPPAVDGDRQRRSHDRRLYCQVDQNQENRGGSGTEGRTFRSGCCSPCAGMSSGPSIVCAKRSLFHVSGTASQSPAGPFGVSKGTGSLQTAPTNSPCTPQRPTYPVQSPLHVRPHIWIRILVGGGGAAKTDLKPLNLGGVPVLRTLTSLRLSDALVCLMNRLAVPTTNLRSSGISEMMASVMRWQPE